MARIIKEHSRLSDMVALREVFISFILEFPRSVSQLVTGTTHPRSNSL